MKWMMVGGQYVNVEHVVRAWRDDEAGGKPRAYVQLSGGQLLTLYDKDVEPTMKAFGQMLGG